MASHFSTTLYTDPWHQPPKMVPSWDVSHPTWVFHRVHTAIHILLEVWPYMFNVMDFGNLSTIFIGQRWRWSVKMETPWNTIKSWFAAISERCSTLQNKSNEYIFHCSRITLHQAPSFHERGRPPIGRCIYPSIHGLERRLGWICRCIPKFIWHCWWEKYGKLMIKLMNH